MGNVPLLPSKVPATTTGLLKSTPVKWVAQIQAGWCNARLIRRGIWPKCWSWFHPLLNLVCTPGTLPPNYGDTSHRETFHVGDPNMTPKCEVVLAPVWSCHSAVELLPESGLPYPEPRVRSPSLIWGLLNSPVLVRAPLPFTWRCFPVHMEWSGSHSVPLWVSGSSGLVVSLKSIDILQGECI